MGAKSSRPRIPADVERQVLSESGHRCAVCGEPWPLARAHIIPWRDSHEHRAEDLICLCANCHRRADSEGWSQRTLREYKQRPWVLRRFDTIPASTGACLQLAADLLGGAAEITGSGQSGGIRHPLWQLWLELYLVPVERVPATIPIHRITGMLEISGLHSEGFDDVSLETAYDIPPDILRLLHGRSNRPKQITVINPMPALLVAYCQTPEWGPASQPHVDRIRVNLEVAEADYQTLEVVAPLRYLEYTDSTKWRVERN